MQKRDFLHVTAETVHAFNANVKNGLLPWRTEDSTGTWSRLNYTAWNAVKYVAFKELVHRGVSGADASYIMLKDQLQVLAGPLVYKTTGKKGEYTASREGRSSLWPGKTIADDKWLFVPPDFRGEDAAAAVELLRFPMTLQNFLNDLAAGVFFPARGETFPGLVMVNLTEAVRTVLTRAAEINLELEW